MVSKTINVGSIPTTPAIRHFLPLMRGFLIFSLFYRLEASLSKHSLWYTYGIEGGIEQ